MCREARVALRSGQHHRFSLGSRWAWQPAAAQGASQRDRAVALHRRGRLEEAIPLYRDHLRRHPRDAGIWGNLGAALRARGEVEAAVACALRSLRIDGRNVDVLGNLANALKDSGRLDEAVALQRRLVRLQPGNPSRWMNLACALRENRCFEQALAGVDQAERLRPGLPAQRWERAQNLLYLGRYREGFAAYESRWSLGDIAHPHYPCPPWRGESLRGRRLLLHAEQGFGDTLLAARYLPLLKARGARIVLACQPELRRLLATSGADRVIDRAEAPPAVDFHCPMMSLPGLMDTGSSSVPPPLPLRPPAAAMAAFSLPPAPQAALKVGIVWSGSVTFKGNARRSLALSDLLPLARAPSIQFYSLQKGPRRCELERSAVAGQVIDLAPLLHDFADTAAALAQLDAVLMTDSSVAHLAGCMGVPVINLLQYVPYWIYGAGDAPATPWYPSHTLIRQQSPGDWRPVLSRAAQHLQAMVRQQVPPC